MNEGVLYEVFMRFCFNADHGEHGADAEVWNALVNSEVEYMKAVGSEDEAKYENIYEKKYAEVISEVDTAYKKLLERIGPKYPAELVSQMTELHQQALKAESPDVLIDVLKTSRDVLDENEI